MKYVTVADIHDEVLNCRSEDLEYANAFLSRLARNYGVDEQEAQIPPSAVIKRLGGSRSVPGMCGRYGRTGYDGNGKWESDG